MAYTEASKKAALKYKEKKWKRIPLDVPIAEYDQLKEYCDSNNLTVSGFIRKIIKEHIESA